MLMQLAARVSTITLYLHFIHVSLFGSNDRYSFNLHKKDVSCLTDWQWRRYGFNPFGFDWSNVVLLVTGMTSKRWLSLLLLLKCSALLKREWIAVQIYPWSVFKAHGAQSYVFEPFWLKTDVLVAHFHLWSFHVLMSRMLQLHGCLHSLLNG